MDKNIILKDIEISELNTGTPAADFFLQKLGPC